MISEPFVSLIEVCEQVLEYDEAHLVLSFSSIENTLMATMAGPQGQAIITKSVKEFAALGYTYEQAEETLEMTSDMVTESLSELRTKYADSDIKIQILDMVETVYENVFHDILAAYEDELNSIPNILIQKLHPNAKLPTYAHYGDQGADVYAIEDITIPAHSWGTLIHTGLAAVIPAGWAIAVRPRSGMSLKTGMRIANSPGTIDELYRNEIGVIVDNISDEDVVIHAGDRIAQFILEKNYHGNFTEIPDISLYSTDRGAGFGSSGK